MPSLRNRRHILVSSPPEAEPLTTPRSGRAKPFKRPSDRTGHAWALNAELNRAVELGMISHEQAAPAQQEQAGLLVAFRAPPGVELNLKSLENKRAAIEVRSVTRSDPTDGAEPVETANVFIPQEAVEHFRERFERYATQETEKGHPKHRDLVDRIVSIDLAALRALWTDAADDFPRHNAPMWWEIWLQRDSNGQELQRLAAFAQRSNLRLGARHLAFADRTVCLVLAAPQRLVAAPVLLAGDLAELRRAKSASAFVIDLPPAEQALWMDDAASRLAAANADAPAVCVLDTGVTQGHPLIAPGLAVADANAVNPAWGPDDDGGGAGQAGHGTEMAGLALYGDLAPLLESAGPVVLPPPAGISEDPAARRRERPRSLRGHYRASDGDTRDPGAFSKASVLDGGDCTAGRPARTAHVVVGCRRCAGGGALV